MRKKFAIFGDPVEHSLSPLMHNSAFVEFGFDGVYFKEHLKDGSKLKDRFFELNLSGANITVPHKEAAFRAADILDDFAKRANAVNTLVNKDGVLYGYNTDAPGFLNAIKKFDNIKTILILGAGGTAQATSLFLKDAGYNVEILNRSKPRLEYFKEKGFKTYSFDEFKTRPYDLVVNMTSAGLKDENLPAPKEILEKLFLDAKGAVDIIYGKETPFLKLAKSFNLKTADGKDMLIEQGVLAFDYFTNHRFDLEEIRKIMQEALREY
ncbi:MAG: shikimate dehydrogenase [Epsilonproteobacteria bacterium]|nr:shikimate dehydrogenase [Campylobacterota bacterium]